MSDLGPIPAGHVRLVIQDHAESDIKPEPRILHIPVANIREIVQPSTPGGFVAIQDHTDQGDGPVRLIPFYGPKEG